MDDISGDTLKGHGGSISSLPLWVMVLGAVIITLVVGTLVVSAWLDWRRRARRRARRVWRDYPANENKRPLAWHEPRPEELVLKVVAKPVEGEKAA